MARSRAQSRSRMPGAARASKRRVYSQNFLTDPRVAAAMVRIAGVTRDDLVVEIGPGNGQVTRMLARKAGRVLAYEIDPAYAKMLITRYRDHPRVHCIQRDFLTATPPRGRFAVVANIPYGRTSAIVDWCLRASGLASATLLTQLEYARKRTGDFGRWSKVTVVSWPLFDWRLAGRVDRGRFHPVPRVDSGILHLIRRHRALLPHRDLRAYSEMVDIGFTGRGGSLHATLRRRYPSRTVDSAFRDVGIDRATTVGQVSPADWLAVFHRIHR